MFKRIKSKTICATSPLRKRWIIGSAKSEKMPLSKSEANRPIVSPLGIPQESAPISQSASQRRIPFIRLHLRLRPHVLADRAQTLSTECTIHVMADITDRLQGALNVWPVTCAHRITPGVITAHSAPYVLAVSRPPLIFAKEATRPPGSLGLSTKRHSTRQASLSADILNGLQRAPASPRCHDARCRILPSRARDHPPTASRRTGSDHG